MQKNVDSKKHPVLINLMQKLDEIKNEPLSLFIVNAGKMNHGKSSVFNSLLDKDVFASADIRTTTKVAEAEFQPGTFLLDLQQSWEMMRKLLQPIEKPIVSLLCIH